MRPVCPVCPALSRGSRLCLYALTVLKKTFLLQPAAGLALHLQNSALCAGTWPTNEKSQGEPSGQGQLPGNGPASYGRGTFPECQSCDPLKEPGRVFSCSSPFK